MKRCSRAWPVLALNVNLIGLASFHQVAASTCNAREVHPRKILFQTQSHKKRHFFGDDDLPPWALPPDTEPASVQQVADVTAAKEQEVPPLDLESDSLAAAGLEETSTDPIERRFALLEGRHSLEGERKIAEPTPPTWLDRVLEARSAAERAHLAVKQAHKRIAHHARRAHKHLSMLGHRGGPEVITMIYVMTVPVGIMSLGFGALMIARFAESTGDGTEEEEQGPAPTEVLGVEPWRYDSSAGDGSVPPDGRIRVPANSLATKEESRPRRPETPRDSQGLKKTRSEPDMKVSEGLKKTQSEPSIKDPEAAANKLETLHDDLQQALSAVKKAVPEGIASAKTPLQLRFRPFPEMAPAWANSTEKGASKSSSSSASTTVSDIGSAEDSRKASTEEVIAAQRRSSEDADSMRKDRSSSTQDAAGKSKQLHLTKRKGHRSRPADSSDEADENGLSSGGGTLSCSPGRQETASAPRTLDMIRGSHSSLEAPEARGVMHMGIKAH